MTVAGTVMEIAADGWMVVMNVTDNLALEAVAGKVTQTTADGQLAETCIAGILIRKASVLGKAMGFAAAGGAMECGSGTKLADSSVAETILLKGCVSY